MSGNVYLYILVAAGVSLLIRTLPLTLIRRQITSPFLRSFLYYVPYVTLAVMTFPAIVDAAQYPLAGVAALIVGIVLSWLGAGLFPVAVSCCLSVFAAEFLLRLL
jgi:branched-subunit amino acid transport protein